MIVALLIKRKGEVLNIFLNGYFSEEIHLVRLLERRFLERGIFWGYLGGLSDEGCLGVPRGIFEGRGRRGCHSKLYHSIFLMPY